MRIRPVEPEDYVEWLRMRRALWNDYEESLFPGEMADILADADRQAVFVADRGDGRLGGFVELSIHPHAVGCETRNVGYLEGWYVDADIRRRGVGTSLLAAGEMWARRRGCRELASDAFIDNTLSLQAHLARGFSETGRLIHFKKRL
jgi:aminoglycoside 6'-N-acetyltransferase I